jgi:hypothetical protein
MPAPRTSISDFSSQRSSLDFADDCASLSAFFSSLELGSQLIGSFFLEGVTCPKLFNFSL